MAENLKHTGRSKVSGYDQYNYVYGIDCISTKEVNGFYADVASTRCRQGPLFNIITFDLSMDYLITSPVKCSRV